MSANGVSNGAPKQTGKANGYTSKDEVKPHSIAAQMPSTKQAGLAELVICVGGIYASLYVSSFEYSAIDPSTNTRYKPYLGSATRAYNYNNLWTSHFTRKVSLLNLP